MPFDALKGLQEALRDKEKKLARVERSELTEEQAVELSQKLCKLEKGTSVAITFYHNGHYIAFTGKVSKINQPFKYLVIDNIKIFFEDICKLDC